MSDPFRVFGGVNPCCIPSRQREQQAALSRRMAEERLIVRTGSTSTMTKLDGGRFLMGAEDAEGFPADGEGPIREIHVDPFYIDTAPVTNAEYSEFVQATGYQTESERFGWGFVFAGHIPEEKYRRIVEDTVLGHEWWCKVPGADWKHPEGPDTAVRERPHHPVVHMSWNDAQSYCDWAGKRLPREAEWEYAARGGLVQKKYPWGDELTPNGQHLCNIWQGEFPKIDLGDDGFTAPGPVDAFPANGYGLLSVTGNAWEWCQDWFHPTWHMTATAMNPVGPPEGRERVMKGGSYLCHKSYCNRYRPAARTKNTPDSATTNISFRCARDL